MPVLARAILQPKFVHATSDARHGAGERHREGETRVESRERVGQVTSNVVR
jgi:hypothetical protein